jgi:hypothetical protein
MFKVMLKIFKNMKEIIIEMGSIKIIDIEERIENKKMKIIKAIIKLSLIIETINVFILSSIKWLLS